MRRSITTLLLPLAALTACATAGGGGSPPSPYSYSGTTSSAEPMRVRLTEGIGEGLILHLNRPAHAAIFQIVPGQGVALAYGQRAVYSAGETRLMPGIAANRFWRYDNARHSSYSFASGITQGPRHLLVIASERPLQTSRFRGGMLRRVMGTSSYTTMNSRRVVDDLLAVVVPPQPDESWDADVITVWPSVDAVRLPAGELYRVQCRSGGSMWVPLELAAAACRNPSRVLPPQRDSAGTPPRTDSTGVRKPGGRRPQPEPGVGGDGEPARPGTRLSQLRDEMRSYRHAAGQDASRPVRIADLRRELENMRSGDGNVLARWRNAQTGGSATSTDPIMGPGKGSTGRPTTQHEPSSSTTHAHAASPPAAGAGQPDRPPTSEPSTTRPETQPAPPP